MLQQIEGGAANAIYGSDDGMLWVIENKLPQDNRIQYNSAYEIE